MIQHKVGYSTQGKARVYDGEHDSTVYSRPFAPVVPPKRLVSDSTGPSPDKDAFMGEVSDALLAAAGWTRAYYKAIQR